MNTVNTETPIILSKDELASALAGVKTQLREPVVAKKWNPNNYREAQLLSSDDENMGLQAFFKDDESESWLGTKCPFGNIGDVLWVQEKHRPIAWSFDDGDVLIEYEDGKTKRNESLTEEEIELNPNDDYMIAICDELLDRKVPMQEENDTLFDLDNKENLPYWRDAELMPRFASRIAFRITGIKLQRLGLLNMTDTDIKAEGADHFANSPLRHNDRISFYQTLFSGHWDIKHPYFDCGSNPWVWVLDIEQI